MYIKTANNILNVLLGKNQLAFVDFVWIVDCEFEDVKYTLTNIEENSQQRSESKQQNCRGL